MTPLKNLSCTLLLLKQSATVPFISLLLCLFLARPLGLLPAAIKWKLANQIVRSSCPALPWRHLNDKSHTLTHSSHTLTPQTWTAAFVNVRLPPDHHISFTKHTPCFWPSTSSECMWMKPWLTSKWWQQPQQKHVGVDEFYNVLVVLRKPGFPCSQLGH